MALSVVMKHKLFYDQESEIISKSDIYYVEGIVGEGAYGVVLKCSCKYSDDIVAIKKFKDTEDDENVRKTILREVKILRMLKHNNIVLLRDAFRRRKRLYLVFEYMQYNLLQILEKNVNGLDKERIKIYVYQLCNAIKYCHDHDIVHRDIKPENLLINVHPYPMLKLCDFGFARTVQSKILKYKLTDYVATRWYRSPELLLSLGNYGKSVDIWAIGCIMGELIDSQPLFPGESDIDQLFVIRKVLGPLTENQKKLFLKNPRFLGMKLPEIGRPETLYRRYYNKITKKQLKLLKGLLEMDENERFTINQAFNHCYFDDIHEIYKENNTNISVHNSLNNTSINDSISTINTHRDSIHNSNNNNNNSNSNNNSNHKTNRMSINPPITPPLITQNDLIEKEKKILLKKNNNHKKRIKLRSRQIRNNNNNNNKRKSQRLKNVMEIKNNNNNNGNITPPRPNTTFNNQNISNQFPDVIQLSRQMSRHSRHKYGKLKKKLKSRNLRKKKNNEILPNLNSHELIMDSRVLSRNDNRNRMYYCNTNTNNNNCNNNNINDISPRIIHSCNNNINTNNNNISNNNNTIHSKNRTKNIQQFDFGFTRYSRTSRQHR